MTSQEFIENNKTSTFKKGDKVVMHDCIEAIVNPNKIWTCKTDSYKSRSGDDVVFLEGFSGCFLSEYLVTVS